MVDPTRARTARVMGVATVALTVALGVLPAAPVGADVARGHLAARRSKGPKAEIGGPLTGGNGTNLAASDTNLDLDSSRYVEEEYSASGTATSYTGTQPANGRFDLTPSTEAAYATRIIVRRPKKRSRFDGTVVVEWLNVSGGLDAAPDWTYLEDEILREGHAWVGVSAQLIGIDGGPVAVVAPQAEAAGAGKGIVNIDPARYGSLHHPGDAFSFDIYTQVARALRKPGKINPLGKLRAKELLGVGESQSAFALTTYIDGVQPLARTFDGFLVHSRGAAAFPLGEPGQPMGIQNALSGKPTIIRTDLKVPVIIVETETDLVSIIGYYPARQRDSKRVRLWEVAGTAHADKQQVGDTEADLGCSAPVNRGQQGFVLASALHHLDRWAAGGAAPPKARRLEIVEQGGEPTLVTDRNGLAKGGIRTPAVVAPVDLLSGLAPANATVICMLFGQTQPLSAEQLAALYENRAEYVADYAKATSKSIARGFVVAGDRKAVIAQSQPDRISSS